eukprot:1194597-Prorocentrum_minimum.AAC.3
MKALKGVDLVLSWLYCELARPPPLVLTRSRRGRGTATLRIYSYTAKALRWDDDARAPAPDWIATQACVTPSPHAIGRCDFDAGGGDGPRAVGGRRGRRHQSVQN